MHDRIKVNNKTNNLSSAITISRSSSGNLVTVVIQPGTKFSKRYLKYLTKKFLKKANLKDWLRVVASKKDTYELRYYNIAGQDEDEAE